MTRSVYCEEIRRCLKYELQPAKNRGFYICPLCGSGTHKNGTGALKIYNDIRWYCHACGNGGDIFDLLEKRDNLTPEAARQEIENRYGWARGYE